tara:strand:- start:5736 stop:6653 length:918 start_codon:yes stop_codon:yes gene_type:complete
MENKDKFVPKPLIATIRESVAKDVEAVSRKLGYLHDLSKNEKDPDGDHINQEFVKIERFFITKDNISKLFDNVQELTHNPVSDYLLEGDPRRTEGNFYEMRGKAYANFNSEYLYDGGTYLDHEQHIHRDAIKDFTIPMKSSYGRSVTKELAEQINHGILVIDLQFDELQSVGHIVMSGQGLKALKEPHPIVYRMLTSDSEGKLIFDKAYKNVWEPEEYVEFKIDGLGTEEVTKRVENLYCWKYWDREGHIDLDTSHGKGYHVNEDDITVPNKRICRDRKDLNIGPDNTRCLVSELLHELTADQLL